MDQVALNDNLRAAVHVNAVGIVLVTLTRIVDGRNIVNGIARDRTVPGVVVRWVGRNAFKANYVDSNVVVIVDDVVGDDEVGDISVDVYRFAGAGPEVINLVTADRDSIERSRRGRAVHGNAEGAAGGF